MARPDTGQTAVTEPGVNEPGVTEPRVPNAESQAQPQTESFQESWSYWKKRNGSAEHSNRKFSSIDPLEPAVDTAEDQQPTPLTPSRERVLLNGAEASKPPVPWSNYFNVFNYIPPETFHFTLNKPSEHHQLERTQSEVSSQVPTGTWFSWMNWNARKDTDDELIHDLQSSTEIKRNVKEAKKATQNADAVWAWYHLSGTGAAGEASVLGTKTETSPVEMKKYPSSVPMATSDPQPICIVPDFKDSYREITLKTKIRIAAQLYYNYPTEKHLYLKRSIQSPVIKRTVIVSIVTQAKLKYNVAAKQLSDLTSESLKTWFKDNELCYSHHIETISIEAAKIVDGSLESLFKLLINWRENLMAADCVIFVGYKHSIPLAAQLLQTIISRALVDETQKFGLISIDGTIPGPYLDEQEANSVAYFPEFDSSLSRIIDCHNVKVGIVGTLNNLSGSLALHLEHPNIFRTVYVPKAAYDNRFERHLLELLLMAHNLGQPSTRLLVQLSKYFTALPISNEELSPDLFTAPICNCLNTTRLTRHRPLNAITIRDSILDNNYNLVWTLHAFLDSFKTIKHIAAVDRIQTLVESYKAWDPQTKPLKDLKYMLEVLKIDDYSQAMLLN